MHAYGENAIRTKDAFPLGEVVHIVNPNVIKCELEKFYRGQTVRFGLEVNDQTRIELEREWTRMEHERMTVRNWVAPDGWYDIDCELHMEQSELTRGVPRVGETASSWVKMIMDDRIKYG